MQRVITFKLTSDLNDFLMKVMKGRVCLSDIIRMYIPVALSLKPEYFIRKYVRSTDSQIVRVTSVKLKEDVVGDILRYCKRAGINLSEFMRGVLKLASENVLERIEMYDGYLYLPKVIVERLRI